jgi:hypothetical protein
MRRALEDLRRCFVASRVRMRYSIEASSGAAQDISALLIRQISQAGKHQFIERTEIPGQALDWKVAPDHAPLRAEKVEEVTHHTARSPFVAWIAEPAERRQLDADVRKLGQGRHTNPPDTQTRVAGGIGQAKVFQHHRHRRSVGGDGSRLR